MYDRWHGAYVGKLPPEAQEQLDETIESWRKSGLVTHVEVMGAADCKASLTVEGVLYPLASPPALPIVGCDRAPCCGCCYLAVLDDEGGASANVVSEKEKSVGLVEQRNQLG